jgi:hypothetical protein
LRLNCLVIEIEDAQHLRPADLLTSDPFVTIEVASWHDARAHREHMARSETHARMIYPTHLARRQQRCCTTIRKATLHPRWNETFHIPYTYAQHEQRQVLQTRGNNHTVKWTRSCRGNDLDVAVTDTEDHGLEDTENDVEEDGEDSRQLILTVYDDDGGGRRYHLGSHRHLGVAHDPQDNDGSHREALTSSNARVDFLGRVYIRIDPLDHGRCVSAALVLGDEDGEVDDDDNDDERPDSQDHEEKDCIVRACEPRRRRKSKPRGILNVTLQWRAQYAFPLHMKTIALACMAIFIMRCRAQRKAAAAAAAVAARVLPKVTLSQDIRLVLDTITQVFQDGVKALADAIVMADQVQRLGARLQEARKNCWDAEEEKHIELRLRAVMNGPFRQKRMAVMDTIEPMPVCLRSFTTLTYDKGT